MFTKWHSNGTGYPFCGNFRKDFLSILLAREQSGKNHRWVGHKELFELVLINGKSKAHGDSPASVLQDDP